jgi:hypothetical protein
MLELHSFDIMSIPLFLASLSQMKRQCKKCQNQNKLIHQPEKVYIIYNIVVSQCHLYGTSDFF